MLMNSKWILLAALSVGLPVATAPLTASAADKKESRENAKDKDEQIKYAQLPDEVRKTVDKERGDKELKSTWHVVRDGREFYRVVIDTKGDDKVIRIRPGGGLLTEQEARDEGGAKTAAAKAPGVKKQVRVAKDESDPNEVDFDRLPGNVKTEIGRLAKADRVQEVVKYNHRGQTMYRAEVGEGKYTRFIRVPENIQAGGRAVVTGDIDPGERIAFDRTPGPVKSKIGSLAKSGKVEEVIEYDRGSKKYYQAQVEDKSGKDYFVTVDQSGKEVDRLPNN
jgi:hypothetical protein